MKPGSSIQYISGSVQRAAEPSHSKDTRVLLSPRNFVCVIAKSVDTFWTQLGLRGFSAQSLLLPGMPVTSLYMVPHSSSNSYSRLNLVNFLTCMCSQ
jgi:hypothetical protein